MTRPLAALLGAAALLSGALPAGAVETPRPGPTDPRIRIVDYDPDQVVRLVGVLRTATQVLFSPDESIVHVAIGDTAAWEVAPERNILFLKPTALAPPTNLIVTTEVGPERRHYVFELSSRPGRTGRDAADTFFGVRFRYPRQEAERLQAALAARAGALERRLVDLRLERGVLEGPRNLAYELQGAAAIAPSEVSDNGRFTVMRFPGARAIPAVYSVSPDGTEALVPFDVRGEFLVVHLTAAQLRLRRGRAVVCIHNLAYDPDGRANATGTATDEVERTGPGAAR